MKIAIRKFWREAAAVVGLIVLALAVATYILGQQGFRFPVIGTAPKHITIELSNAQAVEPGQGQTVRVAGIEVGRISGVKLDHGVAAVDVEIDHKYDDLIREDATALLRPKTALKDMFIEVSPGTGKVVPAGGHISAANTLPDVDPDEIFGALDADTRPYLKLLVNGAGEGLKGRGNDLNEVFKRFEPTHKDLLKVNAKVAERHENLRRLIHNLNLLNGELAGKSTELTQLVDQSAAVFRAFASQNQNITTAVNELPDALRTATSTLTKVQRFADVLGPAARDLTPVAPQIDRSNKAVEPLAKEATPILASQIRPFVRDARPLVRNLKPAAHTLSAATPNLTRSFVVLNHLFNMLGFNPNGREGPTVKDREEGYLFRIAWLQHNGAAAFATADADQNFRPVTLGGTCGAIKASVTEEPQLEFLEGLTGALTDSSVCGTSGPLPAIPATVDGITAKDRAKARAKARAAQVRANAARAKAAKK
jgi:phospholipid/cholesterol/gamma-HCH transport system substrate-binding protein